MSKRLPELIEPVRLAETRRLLSGQMSVTKMRRLRSMLNKPEGKVTVELSFDVDEAGLANVTGHVSAQLELVCQRCMEPMHCTVNENVSLAVVKTEHQTDKLPEQYEPLLVDEEGMVSLTEIVEDEIILAIPVSSLHELDDCPAKDKHEKYTARDDLVNSDSSDSDSGDSELAQNGQAAGKQNAGSEAIKPKNPFAALAQLKTKK